MAKPLSRDAVFDACDRLLLSEGSIKAVSYRMLYRIVGGASQRVRTFYQEWIAEREKWVADIPPTLERQLRELIESLWLVANIKVSQRQPRSEQRPAASLPRGADMEAFFAEMDEMRRTVEKLTLEVQRKPAAVQFVAPGPEGTAEDEGGPSIAPELPFSKIEGGEGSEADLPEDVDNDDLISFSDLTVAGKKKAAPVDPDQQTFDIVPDNVRRRATKADWEGAENKRIAERVAAILRREGMPLRAEEFKRELLEFSPGWQPTDFSAAIARACEGSKIRKINRAMWWFHGEDVPWRSDPMSEEAKRRRQAKLVLERILEEIKKRGTAVPFNDLMKIANRGPFDKDWLKRRLESLLVQYPDDLKIVDDGYLWTKDDRDDLAPASKNEDDNLSE
jgi:hypothetical protein